MSNLMVSVSGIRGVVGETFRPPVIVEFTAAFASCVGKGKIVVGRDTRQSGEAVFGLVSGTLMACGCDVVDVGITPTPAVEVLVKLFGATGGIVITASHNNQAWNALKFVGANGMFFDQVQSDKMLEVYKAKCFSYVGNESTGNCEKFVNANERYLEYLFSKVDVENIKKKKFRVVIDSCNGAGSEVTPVMLQRLNCEVIKLNCDAGKGFPRNPEPTRENLVEVIKELEDISFDVGFVQDPDADRLAIISNKAEYIGEEYTLALCADYWLAKNKGAKVVVNLSTSMLIDRVAARYGTEVYRSKVGEINVAMLMKEVGAIFGGEGNGGVICPEFHYGRDSLVGILLVLFLMAERECSLSDLVESLPRFFIIKEKFELDKKNFVSKFCELKKAFASATVNELDGLKFCWPDKWVHVRPSNTEPLVRVIVEAESEKEAICLLEKVKEVLLCVEL
jgi:phosphomannomutase